MEKNIIDDEARARHGRVSAFAARVPCPRKTSYSQECIYRLENFRDVTPERANPARETSFYRESRPRDAQREPSRVRKIDAEKYYVRIIFSRGLFYKFTHLSISPFHEDYPPKGFIVKLFASKFEIFSGLFLHY